MHPGENAGHGLTDHPDILGAISPVIQCGEHIRLCDLHRHILHALRAQMLPEQAAGSLADAFKGVAVLQRLAEIQRRGKEFAFSGVRVDFKGRGR